MRIKIFFKGRDPSNGKVLFHSMPKKFLKKFSKKFSKKISKKDIFCMRIGSQDIRPRMGTLARAVD